MNDSVHSHVRRFQMQANESVACMQALVSGSSGQGRRQGRRNDGWSYSDARVGTAWPL